MIIPIVFWLVLISYGDHNSGNTTVLPVPFATIDDCISAGKQVQESATGFSPYVVFACPAQRETDITGFHSNPYEGRDKVK